MYTAHYNTSTATSTAIANTYTDQSTIIVIHSESIYMVDHTTMMDDNTMTEPMMMDTTSSQLTFDVFTMSSCTGCITAPLQTSLITAAVSAQDFTLGISAVSVSNIIVATPTYYMQSTLITAIGSVTTSAPSAGFATTSLAVFTGSAGRHSVDYLVAVALPVLVGMLIWV
jgi:hypothetical protein